MAQASPAQATPSPAARTHLDAARPTPGASAAHPTRTVHSGPRAHAPQTRRQGRLEHDGGGNRAQTVAALHLVIPRLQAHGYHFATP
jgi:hypothetical protein